MREELKRVPPLAKFNVTAASLISLHGCFRTVKQKRRKRIKVIYVVVVKQNFVLQPRERLKITALKCQATFYSHRTQLFIESRLECLGLK